MTNVVAVMATETVMGGVYDDNNNNKVQLVSAEPKLVFVVKCYF